jgi:phage I-like protein
MPISLAHILPLYRVSKDTPFGEFSLEMDDEATRAVYVQSLRDQIAGHRPSVTREHSPEDGSAFGRVLDVVELSDDEAHARGYAGGGLYAEVEWDDAAFEGIRSGRYRFVSGRFIKGLQAGGRVFPLYMSHLTLTADPVFGFGQTELQTLAEGAAVPAPVILSGAHGDCMFAASLSNTAYVTQPDEGETSNGDRNMDELINEIRAALAEHSAAIEALTAAVHALAPGEPDEAEAGNDEPEEAEASQAAPAPTPDAGLSRQIADQQRRIRELEIERERMAATAEVDGLLSRCEVAVDRDELIKQRVQFGAGFLSAIEKVAAPKASGAFAGQLSHAAPAPAGKPDWTAVAREIDEAHRAECSAASLSRTQPRAWNVIAGEVCEKHSTTYGAFLSASTDGLA